MINGITYTATANKTNNNSVLDATEWNALSQAVAGIAGSFTEGGNSGKVRIEASNLLGLVGVNSIDEASSGWITLRNTSSLPTIGVDDIGVASKSNVKLMALGNIDLEPAGDVSITTTNGTVQISADDGSGDQTNTGILLTSSNTIYLSADGGADIKFAIQQNGSSSYDEVSVADLYALVEYFKQNNPNNGIQFPAAA